MKNLKQPFSWIIFILFGVVTVFVLTGLPYDQFNWTAAMAEYGNPDTQPTTEPPAALDPFVVGDPVQTVLPATAPEVTLPGQTTPVLLANVLFAPERKTINVGVQSVIDRGVIRVVDYTIMIDGHSYTEPFGVLVRTCLQGEGKIVFLAADQSPRVPVDLESYVDFYYDSNDSGIVYTCGWIDRPGLVVLVEE
jgi:hypothetical protein